jgi:hypothetical protein
MIAMSAEVVLELMKHSRRSKRPLTALVVEAVEQWLLMEKQAICANPAQSKDFKHLRGREEH